MSTDVQKIADAIVTALDAEDWASYREDRVRIVAGVLGPAIAGVEIAKLDPAIPYRCPPGCTTDTHATSCLRAPERREIAERAAEYRRKVKFT